jgi:release factor glutamine methyltransferase
VKGYFIPGWDLWCWRQEAQQQAIAAGISAAEVDWLLRELVGIDRLSLRLESFKDLPQIALPFPPSTLAVLWQQRTQARVPVQYLTGRAPWRNFSLTVSPAVLIPRPETECLIDRVLSTITQASNPALSCGHWADLGTGSGAIALALAKALPQATLHAIDRSAAALAVAQQNAEQLGLAARIQFYQGSWFEPIAALQGQLSGMVSNPPYIPTAELPTLQPEVFQHEPHLALDGGTDGLDCIRHLITTAPQFLQPGGIWLIEMMAGQAAVVHQLLNDQGSYDQIEIYPDLSGIDRFALAKRR